MFSSISACAPNTLQTTSYTANTSHSLSINTNVSITVNGQLINARPVPVTIGSTVRATVTSPANYLDSVLYPYSIDGVASYFAVVNRNNYTPRLKTENEGQRWYNYAAQTHLLSFKAPGQPATDLSLAQLDNRLTANLHIVPDPLTSTVYFYNKYGWPVSNIKLPSPPIDCQRIQRILPLTNELEEFYLVLSNTGILYRINLDKTTLASSVFEVEIYSNWIFEDFYDIDLEFRGSFTSIARARQQNALRPNVTSFGFDGTNIWLAGRASLWLLDLDFNILNEYTIPEFVNGMAIVDEQAFITTKNSDIYRLDKTGTLQLIYQSQAVGPPEIFENFVYVPECSQARLIKINPMDLTYTFVQLENVAPAYLKADTVGLYISCHDNNQVFLLKSNGNVEASRFENKVTWVSAIDGYLIASHWLKDFVMLVDGLKKILPIALRARRGTQTHIGTTPVKIKAIGETTLPVTKPDNVIVLANGKPSNVVSNNDFMGVAYSVTPSMSVFGKHRFPLVIGEDAFDYDVEVVQPTANVRNVDFGVSQINSTEVKVLATLPLTANATASLEYGTITVNGVEYQGDPVLNTGDTVEIVVPMSNNQQPIAPIFTLEGRQFAVPISSSTTVSTIQVNDLAKNQIVPDKSFTAQATGIYTVPRYAEGSFIIKKNNSIQATAEIFANAGDILTISNLTASNKIFDEKSIFIVGPTNYKLQTKTASYTLIDPLVFNPLIEPFARTEEPYVSNTLGVTGADALGAQLILTDSQASFIIDGVNQGQTANVFTGNQISVSRTLNNYYEGPLLIYQQYDDDTEIDTVYRGQWPVSNLDLTAEILHETNDHNKEKSYIIDHNNYGHDFIEIVQQIDNIYLTSQSKSRRQLIKLLFSKLDTDKDTVIDKFASWFGAQNEITRNLFLGSNDFVQSANFDKLFTGILAAQDQYTAATSLNFNATQENKNYQITNIQRYQTNIDPATTLQPIIDYVWVHDNKPKLRLMPQSVGTIEDNLSLIFGLNSGQHKLVQELNTIYLLNYSDLSSRDTQLLNTDSSPERALKNLKFEINYGLFDSADQVKIKTSNPSMIDKFDITFKSAANESRSLLTSTVRYNLNITKHLAFEDTVKIGPLSGDQDKKTKILKINDAFLNALDQNFIVKDNQIKFNQFDKTMLSKDNRPALDAFDKQIHIENTPWTRPYQMQFSGYLTNYDRIIPVTELFSDYTEELRKINIIPAGSNQYDHLKAGTFFVEYILMQHKKSPAYFFGLKTFAADEPHIEAKASKEFAKEAPHLQVTATKEFSADDPHLTVTVTKEFAADDPHLRVTAAKEFAADDPHLVVRVTKEFAADDPHLVIPLVPIEISRDDVGPVILLYHAFELDREVIWTSQQLENYGAFLTAQDAATAAIAAGYLNYLTIPIYRSNYYTYEVFVTPSSGCAVPPIILRPVAWLIRGG